MQTFEEPPLKLRLYPSASDTGVEILAARTSASYEECSGGESSGRGKDELDTSYCPWCFLRVRGRMLGGHKRHTGAARVVAW